MFSLSFNAGHHRRMYLYPSKICFAAFGGAWSSKTQQQSKRKQQIQSQVYEPNDGKTCTSLTPKTVLEDVSYDHYEWCRV